MQPAAPPSAPRRRLLRRLRPVALVVLLGAATLGGDWWWQVGRFQESTDNAYLAGDITPLAARIEGDVAEILVADNQQVTAGQVLIRLEQQDWRARRDSAAASLAAAEATQATILAQRQQQLATIAAVEASIRQAEAERVRATQDAVRYETLAVGGVGARQAAERSLADQRKAEAALAAAQANLTAARAALPVLDAQAAGAESQVIGARAALALAESSLAYTEIRAPFDGVAGNRAAQIGQHVRPGQMLISVARPPEQHWLVANFKETQLARMRPGQPVTVTLDVTGAELRAHIDSLAPATGALFSLLPPENATGNFTRIVQRVPVKIRFDDPAAALLRPGLSAVAEVDTRDDPSAPRGVWAVAAATLGLRP
ncbi:HlyD family secretion protein [Siccirubricoccus sp. KC 17139]|uniref:HlyD family secretion protein n=1 Tax=Siccirubricoccus soli TaxID=2899147 RepID=A0ABT1D5A4_9PROT|nr:HlyD family secretion protein [Siccirubricoccus soli]MCO6417102.1 HlyD family secretion protein [Siccirubricoccus soli]MCP2683237.1 HlyD family secretion protein [Siccirubricoccus soli]